MGRLDEHEVALSFIGKSVDMEKLLEVFEADGNEYIAECRYLGSEELNDKFHITEHLEDKWLWNHIDIRVNVSLEDGKIAKCSILKLTEDYGYVCNGRLQEHWIEAPLLQQEIRVFRRIMEYVVQE